MGDARALVAVDPGFVARVVSYRVDSAGGASGSGALAACGPGLYWSIADDDVVGLLEGVAYPLGGVASRADAVWDVQCPLSGGVLVATRSGKIAWSRDIGFTSGTTFSSGLRDPGIAVGPRDELWVWQRSPGVIVVFDQGHRSELHLEGAVAGLAAAAPHAAVMAIGGDGESTRLELVQSVGVPGNGTFARTEIAQLAEPILGVAVLPGGRVLASTPSCLRLYDAHQRGTCIASLAPGAMASRGDEAAVLSRQGDRLTLLTIADPASQPAEKD